MTGDDPLDTVSVISIERLVYLQSLVMEHESAEVPHFNEVGSFRSSYFDQNDGQDTGSVSSRSRTKSIDSRKVSYSQKIPTASSDSLEKSSSHSKSNNSSRSGGRKLLSDNLVKGPKKSHGSSVSMKSCDTTSTAASDADRAQRRIERAQLLEKKKAHEERRRKLNRRHKKNLERTSSEGSMDTRELGNNSTHSDGGGNHSFGSIDSSTAKSILKNGKFASSNPGSVQSKGKKNKSRNSESSNSSLTGSNGNLKAGGVKFAQTTVFHGDNEEPRGSALTFRDDQARSRSHLDEFEGQDSGHASEEARSRRHVEMLGSSEYSENRRQQRQIPYQHDPRRLRNPGPIPNRHMHQHPQQKIARSRPGYQNPQNGPMIGRTPSGPPRINKQGQMHKSSSKNEGSKSSAKRKGDNASSSASLTKAQIHMAHAKAAFASVP